MFDTEELTDLDLVSQLRAAERTICAAQAEQLAILAELHARCATWIDPVPGGCPEVSPIEVAAAEVSAALRWSTLAAADRVALALNAAERVPRSLAALARGRFTLGKLRALLERTVDLTPQQVAVVEDAVLGRAAEQTPTQFTAGLRRAVLRCDPQAASRRAEQARRERCVDMYPADDGMAVLRALLSAADALRCHQVLTDHARAQATVDSAAGVEDERTLDARRADLLVECLLDPGGAATPSTTTTTPSTTTTTGPPHAGETDESSARTAETAGDTVPPTGSGRPSWIAARTQVHVTVPWTVLAGLSDTPGELSGYGPIDAGTARCLANSEATWRRILTDPATGAVLDVGTTSYHPPAALDHFVRTRDRTCRFPGCRRSARRADLDHTVPYPHGPTSGANLAALCRPHHRLKTHTHWRVEQVGVGRLEWTSPTGLIHTSDPPEAHPPDEPDLHAEG